MAAYQFTLYAYDAEAEGYRGAVIYTKRLATNYMPRNGAVSYASPNPYVNPPIVGFYYALVDAHSGNGGNGLYTQVGKTDNKVTEPSVLNGLHDGEFGYTLTELGKLVSGQSATPSFVAKVEQITTSNVTFYALAGQITAPVATSSSSGTVAALGVDAAVSYVAGNPTVLPTMTTPASVFRQWVAIKSLTEPTAPNRNAEKDYVGISDTQYVSASTTFVRTVTSTDVIGGFLWWVYLLFKDGTNVAPAFDFNKLTTASSGAVTVSTLTGGVYVPFTRYTDGAAALAAKCTAFTANEFDILAAQTTSFYPKNHVSTAGNITLTFRPATGYVIAGWSFSATRPATPDIITSAQVYTLAASALSGIHVFLAPAPDPYGLIVREFVAGETLPTNFTAMPITNCVLDGVTYPTPVETSRKGSVSPTPTCVFNEDVTATTSKALIPGAIPTIVKLLGATGSEYTSLLLAANTTPYTEYPVYGPAYRQYVANLALDFSIGGSLITAATMLSGAQGSVDLEATGAFPLASVDCWCASLAKGMAAVFEVDITLAEGAVVEELSFGVTGVDNAQAVYAFSDVYGKSILTVSLPMSAVTAGTADIEIWCVGKVNVATVTPQVCLEVGSTLIETVEGVYPLAQSPVFGALSIGTAYTAGGPFPTVSATVTPISGYTPNRIEVVVGTTVRSVRLISDGTEGFATGLLDADEGEDVVVRMIVRPDVCPAPTVSPETPSLDGGLFTAKLENLTDPTSNLWHVGDMARITVLPVVKGGSPMPGVVVYSITYNGQALVVSGSPVQGDIALDKSGAHVFQVAMAGSASLSTQMVDGSAFTPTTTPPTISITGGTIVVGATTYYRLGSAIELTLPLTSNSKTAVLVRHNTSLVADGFADTTLAEYAASELITLTLQGNDDVVVLYTAGTNQHSYVCMAVFDYATATYLLANRPTCSITAVSPAVLGPNTAFTADKPESGVDITPPDADYWAAVNVVAQITSDEYLPAVRASIVAGGVGYLLERWSGAAWLPVTLSSGGILLSEDTFLRYSRGYPADQLINFSIAAAEDTDANVLTNRPAVSALVSGVWDYTGQPPFAYAIPKGSTVSLFAFAVAGYRFLEWRYADDTVVSASQGCSIQVGLVDVEVYPVYEVLSVSDPNTIMVLNGSAEETETGLWVSKEYRAQNQWSPVVGAVIRANHEGLCRLIVHSGRVAHITRAEIVDASRNIAAITISDDKMRRIPLPQNGISRFHRFAIMMTGGEVCSIAVSTGAQTLKGAH